MDLRLCHGAEFDSPGLRYRRLLLVETSGALEYNLLSDHGYRISDWGSGKFVSDGFLGHPSAASIFSVPHAHPASCISNRSGLEHFFPPL